MRIAAECLFDNPVEELCNTNSICGYRHRRYAVEYEGEHIPEYDWNMSGIRAEHKGEASSVVFSI